MTKRSKIILICVVAAVLMATVTVTLCLTLIGRGDDLETPGITMSLNVNAYQLAEDETFMLTATTNSTDIVKWTSSNPAVASVSSQGRVIAKTVGETTITATAGEATDTCRLTVVADPGASTTIVTGETILRLSAATGAQQILGSVKTADGEMSLAAANAAYRSDDPSVATVSADGTVTPVSVGSTTILVTAAGRTKALTVEVYTMLVSSAGEWNAMLDLPGDLGARFYVTDDIDFTGVAYRTKARGGGKVLLAESMSGSLDGGGHTVRNITFDPDTAEQSLFGTIVGFSLSHIAFENVHFTAGNAAGLAMRMMQHYDELDGAGNFTGDTVFAPTYLSGVYADFVYDAHGATGIAGTYYGGGIEDVFVNMRMSDGGAMNPNADFAIARKSMVWWNDDPNWFPNNYVNNVVVLSEAGTVSSAWDTTLDGAGSSVDLALLYICNGRMDAGYYVRTLFDSGLWSVMPGQLPKLK